MPMPNLSTSASSSTASSSASTFCSDFEVFINHRGPDVKYTFASHRYRRLLERGLSVFLDKSEMEEGHNIRSQFEEAIRGASVHVAILSPRYAESIWCLNELLLMIKSRSTILPVFYKVDPCELRWTVKDGAYAKALHDLEQKTTHDPETGEEQQPRYGPDTIQEWRNALSYVSNLSGFLLPRDKDDKGNFLDNVVEHDEGELLDGLVKRVLENVPKPPLDVAKYPTGLDLKLEEFEKTVLSQQLERDLVEAKVVGIVGAGGIGKTTLAKEFFNLRRSDYNRSSFLFDMRENARTKSIAYLQNKLLGDLQIKDKSIQIENRDEGIGILKKKLSFCHVLIVLYDVDHVQQLDAILPIQKILRPGSLILVTSRDKSVLTASGVSEEFIYIMKEMNQPHSKELFCSYAFHQLDPLQEFADLVDRFVTASGCLPLCLKVFGALVCRVNKRSVWLEILDELDNIVPTTEIHERLRISYDSLSSNVKEIFLDIACFFLGEDGDKAIRIWGEMGVQNLKNKCLMELDEQNKIKMHDHIRDMGRQIAYEGSMPRRFCYPMTNFNDDLFQQWSPAITEVRGIKMFSKQIDFFKKIDAFYWPYYPSRRPLHNRHPLEMRHPLAMRNLLPPKKVI